MWGYLRIPLQTCGELCLNMATVKQLRLKARLSIQGLGRLANVDPKTIRRAEDGRPVQELKAVAIVEALGEALGQELTVEDVENLHIYHEPR